MVAWSAASTYVNGFGGMKRSVADEVSYHPYGYYFDSPGSVDANAVTRVGIAITGIPEYEVGGFAEGAFMMNGFNAAVEMSLVAGDFTANPGKKLTASMFVAPVSDFAAGAVPTPSQIIAAAHVSVFRPVVKPTNLWGTGHPTSVASATTAGTYAFIIPGPQPAALSPNSKYWVLVIPTAIPTSASTPSVANDIPIGTVATDTIGRAVSAWTGRTPLAPIITSPAPGAVAGAGSLLKLSFTLNSPDSFPIAAGDLFPGASADMSGLQVQYAPRPTPDNPTPTWIDLPMSVDMGYGEIPGPGWFITGADATRFMQPFLNVESLGLGAARLWHDRSLDLRCGVTVPLDTDVNTALLPVGDWQLRMRTFNYGHSFATITIGTDPVFPQDDTNRLGAGVLASPGGFDPFFSPGPPWAPTTFTADTFPALNTSPWSSVVNISVPKQVPAPVLVSPINSRAVVVGTALSLNYNYRNTAALLAPMFLTAAVSTGATTSLMVDNVPEDMPAGLKIKLSNGQTATLASPVGFGANKTLTINSLVISSPMAVGVKIVPLAYPQKTRTIQMRKAGDAWTTVVAAEATISQTWLVTGFPLVDTTHYEWRVQVTDITDTVSEYSSIGSFWVVPEPDSGGVRPDPSETIDGATLGCGTHRAFIFRRGGKRRVAEITGLSYVDWSRVRDDISTAKIVVSDWDIDCGNLLAMLHCWAYELVIFRNNGFGEERVWEGPITLLTYTETSVTVEAKDVMAYAYRRIMKDYYSDAANGDTVVNRATNILQAVFAPDDPNVLAYLNPIISDEDAREYRTTPAYSRTAFEEVDDMAANAGLDYVAVGRAISLWTTRHRIGTLPEFKDSDLGASPIVSEYGMSMANRYVVADGNGAWGEATRLDVSGNDPIYGLVEMLSSSWASDSASDSGTYTQAGLASLEASFAEAAESSITDRYPNPVVVRIPDNTSLNPGVAISIQQLIPGVVIPLRSFATLRTVVGNQKLDSVKVVDQNGKETVSITLSPFNYDAVDDEGGGE